MDDLWNRADLMGASQQILFAKAAATVYATWNPSDKNAGITLSNTNHTAAGAANIAVRSQAPKSSGKWYAEYTVTTAPGSVFAVADSSANLSSYPGADVHSWGYVSSGAGNSKVHTNTFATYGASWTAADVIGVALDMDNFFVYFSKNGTYQNSGVPTSGASGTGAAYGSLTGALMLMIGDFSGSFSGTVNCGDSAFITAPPSGYSAWTNP